MRVPQKESGIGASVLPTPTNTGRIATLKYFEGQDFELHSDHHSDIARESTCVPEINDQRPPTRKNVGIDPAKSEQTISERLELSRAAAGKLAPRSRCLRKRLMRGYRR